MLKFVPCVLTTLLLTRSADAFIPRPTSSSPWGITDSTAKTESVQKDKASTTLHYNIFGVLRKNVKKNQGESNSISTSRKSSSESTMETNATTGPRRIIIAGAPASGKGTQCEKITAMYGVVHLSTGDMLRAAVAAGTTVGVEAKQYMDAGKLVPDSTMIGIVKDRLKQEDCQTKGWLLDGFPRTEAQAKALEEAGISADCFIFLNVPDEVLVERVIGRRTDPVTGKIYHMTFSPPTDEEVIARLQHRSDDTEEKVKVRLEQFHANVEAVKGSYADIGVTINGNQNPTLVTEQIIEAIGSLVTA